MNRALFVRAFLRLVAILLVTWGLLSEGQAEVIYTDPDIVGFASLALAEVYFYSEKGVAWLRNRWAS